MTKPWPGGPQEWPDGVFPKFKTACTVKLETEKIWTDMDQVPSHKCSFEVWCYKPACVQQVS